MNFSAAETYLLSLGNEVSAMKLGLSSMRRLLAELGDPQTKFLKVQIAGTNGKGSACAFLDAILRSAKLRAGLYTSPHLESMTERVKIAGENISETDFARHASRVRKASERLVERGDLEAVPTYFEQMTAIALLAFKTAKVEVAILETGLGGRLAATTAAEAEIAAITRIDGDHEKYLGRTLKKIAAEKAAIIRGGTAFAVIGEQSPVISRKLKARCREVEVPFVDAALIGARRADGVVEFVTDRAAYRVKKLGLAGEHQIENAKIAIALAEHLSGRFKIAKRDIETGLRKAVNPGRLERVGRFLLDGAHNLGGVRALAEYLRDNVDQPLTIVFAAMEDKNLRAMIQELFPLARTIVLTETTNSRSASYERLLKEMPKNLSKERTFVTDNVASALQAAVNADASALIVVAGSLYLVGEAKAQSARRRSECKR